jgi:hypothetical protein
VLDRRRCSWANQQHWHAAHRQHRASHTAQYRPPNSGAPMRGHDDQVCSAVNLGRSDALSGITDAHVERNLQIGALLREPSLHLAQVVQIRRAERRVC